MKRYLHWVALAAFFSISLNINLIFCESPINLADIVLQLSFVGLQFKIPYLIDMSFRMIPFFTFQAIGGSLIYSHFCTASVYYFSRCVNRTKWFIQESISLFCVSIVYTISLLLPCSFILLLQKRFVIDYESVILCLYFIVLYTVWLFCTTISVNIVSLKIKCISSYVVMIGLQLFLISLLALLDPEDMAELWLLKMNPISHLVISWHSSKIIPLNMLINHLNLNYDLNVSLVFYLVLTVAIWMISLRIIKYHELLASNYETEVA